jgi:hypothetical protein
MTEENACGRRKESTEAEMNNIGELQLLRQSLDQVAQRIEDRRKNMARKCRKKSGLVGSGTRTKALSSPIAAVEILLKEAGNFDLSR